MRSRGTIGTVVFVASIGLAAAALGGATGCESNPRLQERVFTERASYNLVRDGDRAMERDQPELARAHYRAAIEQHPGNFEAREKLARVLLSLGEPEIAREHLEVVLTEEPDDEDVLDLMAVAASRSGDMGAIDQWIRPLAMRTNQAAAWARLGTALARIGDADAAEQALLQAAEADEGQTLRYQLLLADFYRQLGNEAAALQRYRMALFIDVMSDRARTAIREMGEIPGPSFAIRPAERPAG
jgi:tetratricopeptide (TPR) repeat protein